MIASPGRATLALLAGLLSLLAMGAPARAQEAAPEEQPAGPILLLPPAPPAATPGEPVEPAAPPPGAAPMPEPGAPSEIMVGALPEFDSDSVGTLTPEQGGFGPALWEGAERTIIEELIARIPSDAASPAMHGLARRLLLSAAAPPKGAGSTSVLELRAGALVAMGEQAAAVELLRAAPGRAADSFAARLDVERLLLQGDVEQACALVRASGAGYDEAFWHEALIYCQATSGQTDAAQLGLGLLSEQGTDDEAFLALMRGVLGEPLPDDLELKRIEPLHFALLQSVGRTVTAAMVPRLNPTLLAAVGRSRTAPEEVRLVAAERAEVLGLLPAAELDGIYGDIVFSPEELANPLSAADELGGPRARALLYQVASVQNVDVARAEALSGMWRLAHGDGVFPTAARAAQAVLMRIMPAPELAWFAADATRAAIAAGDTATARVWFDLARQQAGRLPQAAAGAIGLWPLMTIAGIVPAAERDEMSQWWNADTEPSDAEQRERASLALSLLDALGEPVPARFWHELLPGPARVTMTVPSPAVWHSLADASANLRQGETVLLSLLVLGNGGPATASEAELSAVIAALRLVGLEGDARALALEAALAAGL